MANHLTPTELADEVNMKRREVISKCMEMGVPIFNGRIDKTLFLSSLRRLAGPPGQAARIAAALPRARSLAEIAFFARRIARSALAYPTKEEQVMETATVDGPRQAATGSLRALGRPAASPRRKHGGSTARSSTRPDGGQWTSKTYAEVGEIVRGSPSG